MKAEPSRFSSFWLRVAFNQVVFNQVAFDKDAFSKCPKAARLPGGSPWERIGSVRASQAWRSQAWRSDVHDGLKCDLRAQYQAFVRFAVSISAALAAFAPDITRTFWNLNHPSIVSRETSGTSPPSLWRGHDPEPMV
jgi:hypothetical protein